MDDAVEDSVGPGIAVEAARPVLLRVLGAEDRAAGVLAAFHDLVDERADGGPGFVDGPFVGDEELVGGEFPDGFRASHGFVAGDGPLVG